MKLGWTRQSEDRKESWNIIVGKRILREINGSSARQELWSWGTSTKAPGAVNRGGATTYSDVRRFSNQ